MAYGAPQRYDVTTEIVTPATSAALTDLAAVKAELNLTGTDANRDSALERYIKASSAAIAAYCNRGFATQTVRDTFRSPTPAPIGLLESPIRPLQLSSWPVIALTSVTEDGVAINSGSDFAPNKQAGQLARIDASGSERAWTAGVIIAEYSCGFDEIPAEVEDAAIRMVAQRYFARGRDAMLRSEKVAGVWEASYWVETGASANGAISPDIRALLGNYRVAVLA